jgi:type 1 glutamine amidotransferase
VSGIKRLEVLMSKLVALSVLLTTGAALAKGGIPVLLLTGENNHNWRYTSRMFEDTLESTGLFDVTVSDDPADALADWSSLSRYRAIVLDYNGPRWGSEAEANFVRAVEQNGAGVVVIHASNNAFPGWEAYEQMVGLLWRDATGHGDFHEFDVVWTQPDHPIAKGMGDLTNHPDELYHALKNPADATFDLLATAHSSTESRGSGQDEPMALVTQYGKGRIFHTPLGHVWDKAEATKASISDPQFKLLIARATEWVATGRCTIESVEDVREHNTLTDDEARSGWVSLFDGTRLTGLRGYRETGFPSSGWLIADATLQTEGDGPDVVTDKEYESFEFSCDWKVAPGGNSGIIYLVSEDHQYTWQTGPEMQVLDNARHPDGRDPKTCAGAVYAMIPCAYDVTRPAGEWNHATVKKNGTHIEHWLNGFKMAEYEIGSDEFKKMVAASKFASMPDFGKNTKGHIALQAHGEAMWYRNVKVRELD